MQQMISIGDKQEALSSSTDLRIQSWLGKAELWLKLHAHAEKTKRAQTIHLLPTKGYANIHEKKTSKGLIAQLYPDSL